MSVFIVAPEEHIGEKVKPAVRTVRAYGTYGKIARLLKTRAYQHLNADKASDTIPHTDHRLVPSAMPVHTALSIAVKADSTPINRKNRAVRVRDTTLFLILWADVLVWDRCRSPSAVSVPPHGD